MQGLGLSTRSRSETDIGWASVRDVGDMRKRPRLNLTYEASWKLRKEELAVRAE